jgi:hypothetical protein
VNVVVCMRRAQLLGTEGGQLTAFWQVVEQQAKGQGSTNPPFSIIGTNKQQKKNPQTKRQRRAKLRLLCAVGFYFGDVTGPIFLFMGLSDDVRAHHISGSICCVIDSPVNELDLSGNLGDGQVNINPSHCCHLSSRQRFVVRHN